MIGLKKSVKEHLTTDFTDEHTATHPCDPSNPWSNTAIEINHKLPTTVLRSLRSFAAKTCCSGSVFQLMNGRQRSQSSQKETPENLCGATRIELLVVRASSQEFPV